MNSLDGITWASRRREVFLFPLPPIFAGSVNEENTQNKRKNLGFKQNLSRKIGSKINYKLKSTSPHAREFLTHFFGIFVRIFHQNLIYVPKSWKFVSTFKSLQQHEANWHSPNVCYKFFNSGVAGSEFVYTFEKQLLLLLTNMQCVN